MIKILQESPPLPQLGTVPIQQLRDELSRICKAIIEPFPRWDLDIRESTVPTSYGPVPIRLYSSNKHKQAPTLIFFHGGGFALGNLDSVETHCRELAHFAECTVVSVDYPLAPEHPFPAAPNACLEASVWIAHHLPQLGIPSSRLYIGGASAGATLAAVVTLQVRDKGGPAFSGQVLICPLTDADFQTPSYLENAIGTRLTKEQCIWFLSTYCPDASQYQNPLACPLRAKNFADLPPALVVTAECDPLRDEGQSYAKKLKEAGVPCVEVCYPGMMHCFSLFPIDFPEKRDVINRIKEMLHRD